MSLDPSYPIYLGVSQEFFQRMQDLNYLDGDADFTLSMAAAEHNARAFTQKCEERAKKGLGNLGSLLANLIISKAANPNTTITATKNLGVVIKFDTAKLIAHYQVLAFGDEIRIGAEVIPSVLMYISGFYEVVEVEELIEGDLYA
jgi:hypothetical protein